MEEENIELRSEKVRGIIGEIPHFIVRVGISVVLFVFILMLVICYTIKVPTIIECDIEGHKDNTLIITTYGIKEIPVGSSYELVYNNETIYNDTIKSVYKVPTIENGKVKYEICVSLPDTLNVREKNIVINDYSSLKATIKTGEKRLLHKYFPFLE